MPPIAADFVVGLDMVVINADVLERFSMGEPGGTGADYKHFVASIVHNYALTQYNRHSPSTPFPASLNKSPRVLTGSLPPGARTQQKCRNWILHIGPD
jgi:hypothetical protein